MSYEGPFSWGGFEIFGDETLPPDHVKFLQGGEARVFRFDTETAFEVARWPESDAKVTQNDKEAAADAE